MNAKAKGKIKRKKVDVLHDPANHRMRCIRCDGAMLFERFQATADIFYAWRCVNCGDIMDPVVQKNRELFMAQKDQAQKKDQAVGV
ncbi:MAG: hypothetical protein FWH25_01580 [Syntrophorhabdaceae bacterium]|nr:hypothetical protein [Syntrophorhabdaceae bacterium]